MTEEITFTLHLYHNKLGMELFFSVSISSDRRAVVHNKKRHDSKWKVSIIVYVLVHSINRPNCCIDSRWGEDQTTVQNYHPTINAAVGRVNMYYVLYKYTIIETFYFKSYLFLLCTTARLSELMLTEKNNSMPSLLWYKWSVKVISSGNWLFY